MGDGGQAVDGVYRARFTVPEAVIDENGHVNNVAYVQWMQDVAVRHWERVGGMAVNAALGASWVARAHRIEYLAPAYAGDPVEALTWVADIGRVRSTRKYAFRRASDGVLLARGETEWVFVNASTGSPRAIPKEIPGILPVAADPLQTR